MVQVETEWADFKNIVNSKLLQIDFTETADRYDLYAGDGVIYHVPIYKTSPANSDQTDFETNFKPFSNLPVGTGADIIMNAVQIRDTVQKVSATSDNRGFIPKTLIVANGLNQLVNVSVFGSRNANFSNELQLGSTLAVAAATNSYATISDYFPFIRAKVTAAVAPTTGSITLSLEKVRS